MTAKKRHRKEQVYPHAFFIPWGGGKRRVWGGHERIVTKIIAVLRVFSSWGGGRMSTIGGDVTPNENISHTAAVVCVSIRI